MKSFEFMYNYFKLANKKFTTIRGKSRIDQFKLGDVVTISVQGEVIYHAEVVAMKLVKIKDISLAWLRNDTLHSGFDCADRDQFLGFMNSMRKGYKPKLESVEEEVTLFILERCHTAACFRCSDPVVVDKVETHGRVSLLCAKCQTQIKCG